MFGRKKQEILPPQKSSESEIKKYNARLELLEWAHTHIPWEKVKDFERQYPGHGGFSYVHSAIKEQAKKKGFDSKEIDTIAHALSDDRKRFKDSIFPEDKDN